MKDPKVDELIVVAYLHSLIWKAGATSRDLYKLCNTFLECNFRINWLLAI